jgi:polysaccharide export outer membrane protein
LGAGDELRLIVYGEPQLTGNFYVSDQGYISVPLLGDVRAAGLTRAELDREVADGLRQRKLLVNPSVSSDVIQYRPVYILGEVEKPGAYPYQPGLTMLSAVALAGGFTYRGVKSTAQVVRTREGHAVEGRVGPENFLEPGDVLTIYERFF